MYQLTGRLSRDANGDRSGKLPLHVQLSEMLARDVKAGLLADGSRLPPERDLATRLGVAVGTLRKALADLADKGLLERVHGSGNYVRNAEGAATIYGLFHLERIGGGGLPTAEVLSARKILKPDRLPQIGSDPMAHRIRRLRYLDDMPAALEEIWLDGARIDNLDATTLTESLYVYFREELDLWINHADDVVSVAEPPDWKPEDFGSTSTIWGFVERTGFDQENRNVEYSRTWFDPATTRFVARWR